MTGTRAVWRAAVPVAAAMALLGALLFVLSLPRSVPPPTDETISISWRRHIDQPVCVAMSPGGSYFASVDRSGLVRFYDGGGRQLWKERVEGANHVLIARNGQSLLVYSRLNLVYQAVSFFSSSGRLLWRHHVDGSVWGGAVSPDGARVAVTTGNRFIYVYDPNPARPSFRRWQLDGIGHSVTFTPDNRNLVIGTWQESELVCYSVGGTFRWKHRHDTESQYAIQTSADGHAILGVLAGRQSRPRVQLSLWDSGGGLLWMRTLAGFDGRGLVSPSSRYVAASYAAFLPGDSDMVERKIAVFDYSGTLLWEKGGLFLGPRLVAFSPSGSSVICWDGNNSIYNIDSMGRILSKLTFAGVIQRIVPSEDGRIILVYCSDGWLYTLNVG